MNVQGSCRDGAAKRDLGFLGSVVRSYSDVGRRAYLPHRHQPYVGPKHRGSIPEEIGFADLAIYVGWEILSQGLACLMRVIRV
jgi:hypothetical protein